MDLAALLDQLGQAILVFDSDCQHLVVLVDQEGQQVPAALVAQVVPVVLGVLGVLEVLEVLEDLVVLEALVDWAEQVVPVVPVVLVVQVLLFVLLLRDVQRCLALLVDLAALGPQELAVLADPAPPAGLEVLAMMVQKDQEMNLVAFRKLNLLCWDLCKQLHIWLGTDLARFP